MPRLLTLLALAALLSGCYSSFSPGGNSFSNNHFTYASDAWSPKSVELIDTRTGQTLWSVDVPVGKKITMKFERNLGQAETSFPDRMTWVVQNLKSNSWRGKQEMIVPGRDARLVELSIRPAPEYPEEQVAMAEPPALDPEPLGEDMSEPMDDASTDSEFIQDSEYSDPN